MRQCAVYHKKRAAIEAAIIVGVGNYPAIARQYGLKLDCLNDNKRYGHIPQAILTAAQGAEEKHGIDVADLIEECLEISLGSAREARQAGAFSAIGGIMAGPYKTIQVLSGVSSHEITMSMVRNGTGIFKARFDKRGIIDVINPRIWYPVVSPDSTEFVAHVLAWSFKEGHLATQSWAALPGSVSIVVLYPIEQLKSIQQATGKGINTNLIQL